MAFSTAEKHSIFRDIGAYPLNPVLLNHFCSPLIFMSFPTCLNPVAPRGEGQDEGGLRQAFNRLSYDAKEVLWLRFA
jgi:hypothetical protein